MSTKLTPVKLFDLYEGFTDAFSKKNAKAVPYKQYPMYKQKDFSLPKYPGKEVPEAYFIDPVKIPTTVETGNFADHPFFKCPALSLVDSQGTHIPLAETYTPDWLGCCYSKSNEFLFTLWYDNQTQWNYLRVASTRTWLRVGNYIPIPKNAYIDNVPYPFGYVSMCADQQDFLPFPPQMEPSLGEGIATNRYVNILMQRQYMHPGRGLVADYSIFKIGVSNDGQRVITLPYYPWGFESTLVPANTPEQIRNLYDIESMPGGVVYLVGLVLLPTQEKSIRLFKVKAGVVESFLDIQVVPFKHTLKAPRLAIDHAKYNKNGKVSIVVMIGDQVHVVEEKQDDSFVPVNNFTLPSAPGGKNEWKDIIANCGNLLVQNHGAAVSDIGVKANDIALFNYTSGEFRSALLSNSNNSGHEMIYGISLSHPNGFSNNPPLNGIFTASTRKMVFYGLTR